MTDLVASINKSVNMNSQIPNQPPQIPINFNPVQPNNMAAPPPIQGGGMSAPSFNQPQPMPQLPSNTGMYKVQRYLPKTNRKEGMLDSELPS